MRVHSLIFVFLLFANLIYGSQVSQGKIPISSVDLLPNGTNSICFENKDDNQATNIQDTIVIKTDNLVVDSVKSPMYPGGPDSLLVFINKNLNISKTNPELHVEGLVVVRFVVTKTGKILNVKLIRSLEHSYDNEVLRLVSLLPDFIPGTKDGVPVDTYFTLPMRFRSQEYVDEDQSGTH